MIASLALALLGRAVPKWLTSSVAMLIDVAAALALAGGVYLYIDHAGQEKGAAKVTAKVEQQHAARVTEARSDEQHAQAVTDRIGERVKRADDATTTFLRDKIKDLHDAIDATPPAVAGNPPPVLDTDRLSAPVNAVVDRANRAAETADAVTGTDANGTSRLD